LLRDDSERRRGILGSHRGGGNPLDRNVTGAQVLCVAREGSAPATTSFDQERRQSDF